jgi:hypothetical protein
MLSPGKSLMVAVRTDSRATRGRLAKNRAIRRDRESHGAGCHANWMDRRVGGIALSGRRGFRDMSSRREADQPHQGDTNRGSHCVI